MKIAVVTGASSGLGREFVRLLDRREKLDSIWVIARREDRLRALRADVRTPLTVLPLDLTAPDAAAALGAKLAEAGADVRWLICAAGFGKIGRHDEISLADAQGMIDLNCRAAVAVTETVLPHMRAGARVMEICSTAGFQPFPYLSVYAASKAFLYRYSRALRVELLPRRVSVTAVCPYWVRDTEFIPTAKKTAGSRRVRGFPLASRRASVAFFAMNDAFLRLPVSTPGPVCLVHRVAAKFIPSELMMGLWEGVRRV